MVNRPCASSATCCAAVWHRGTEPPETAFQNSDAQDADETSAGTADTNAEDADARDEAVLDMIAMEMGAPDPVGDDEIEIAGAVAEQAHPMEPTPVVAPIVAKAPEPVAVQPVIQAAPPAPAPVPAPAVEMSLGSSLIASGMLKKPMIAANDPLAPIRRMSQAEKIAFFS